MLDADYSLDVPHSWQFAVTYLFVLQANDAGDVFPIWGTCLGFQTLSALAADGKDFTTSVDGENYSVPLNFSAG